MLAYSTPNEAWRQWTRADVRKLKASMYQLADGRFAVYVVNSNRIPAGAKRMKPQPPYPVDPRADTKEALGKVEARHAGAVRDACVVAVEIAKRKLTVHSREVREAMVTKGMLDPESGPEHWLGAAIHRLAKEGILEKSGHTYKYTDAERGIHERTVTVWQLKDDADTSCYDT
jgi:hypothetical protein